MSKATVTNPNTGEIVTVKSSVISRKPPKAKEVTDINQVTGKNPPFSNLRDNPQFSGMEFIIADASFRSSTLGGHQSSFVLLGGWLVAPGAEAREEDYIIISTGSENVQGRVAAAMMAADESGGEAFPLRGTLRNQGRAWFLD